MSHLVYAVGARWGRLAAEMAAARLATDYWPRYALTPPGLRRALTLRVATPYAFFLNWSEIVPADLLGRAECVNFHCTRLPEGRGGAPIENLIRLGRAETVITAHLMTEAVDAGPVYMVSEPVSLAGTKDQIRRRFIRPVADMIVRIVRESPRPTPQVGEPTYFRRLPQAEFEALWERRRRGEI